MIRFSCCNLIDYMHYWEMASSKRARERRATREERERGRESISLQSRPPWAGSNTESKVVTAPLRRCSTSAVTLPLTLPWSARFRSFCERKKNVE
jgi:hypothetical protein